MSLQDIYDNYKTDPAFQHLRDFGSQFVPGYGDDNSPPVLFCGEAPGVLEDIKGRPFVGRAGVKFIEFLEEELDLTRMQVWTTNILKYRPPNNRDPLPSETAASRRYLLAEINYVNPTVVVPLGRHAMTVLITGKVLGRDHSITKASGKTFYSPLIPFPIIPIIHPARVIRPGGETAGIIVRSSFRKVKELIDGSTPTVP